MKRPGPPAAPVAGEEFLRVVLADLFLGCATVRGMTRRDLDAAIDAAGGPLVLAQQGYSQINETLQEHLNRVWRRRQQDWRMHD